jgi:hypothetical protein
VCGHGPASRMTTTPLLLKNEALTHPSALVLSPRSRLCHGYRFTRGVPKMGIAGTGTVMDFGSLWHTVYPYRGIVGMYS